MIYYLIGYMCSGKSTIGKSIAEKYNVHYIDLDNEIEKRSGYSIIEFFKKYGEKEFRKIELETLKDISTLYKNCIISCGGGTPTIQEAMDFMNETGDTLYIKCKPETIVERLTKEEIDKRPLLKNQCNLLSYIQEQLKTREKFYNKAKYIYEENFDFKWS